MHLQHFSPEILTRAEDHQAPNSKILILTVDHGASHQKLGNTLKKALLTSCPTLAVHVVNALERCAPWFKFYYDSYQIPLKYWPGLWGWIENLQHDSKSTGPRWLYRKGAQSLFQFIQAFDPAVVIATEVGTCELAAIMKREQGAKFHLVCAPTGVDVDLAWAQSEADLYILPPGDGVRVLARAGVPPDKLLSCGMPIDPAFASRRDQAAVRRHLGIEPGIPLLLVLFGGTGFGRPKRIVAEIDKIPPPLAAVFITGKNTRLERETLRVVNGHGHYQVKGWVDNMHEWMAAADVLLSKPGASTVIEALNSGLPLLALDPLPGNERRACDWIEKWEVGLWVRRSSDLAPTLTRLLSNPRRLERMRANAVHLSQPRAATTAAEAILNLLEQDAQLRTKWGW